MLKGTTGGVDKEAIDDARRWGFPEEMIAQLQGSMDAPNAFEVWPENVDAVLAFDVVGTQWRTAGFGEGIVFIGFDYAGVRAGLDAAGMTSSPELWSDLRVMEAEALKVLNNT